MGVGSRAEPPEEQGFKAFNYGQMSIQGLALGSLVGSKGQSPRNLRGFRHLIKVK